MDFKHFAATKQGKTGRCARGILPATVCAFGKHHFVGAGIACNLNDGDKQKMPRREDSNYHRRRKVKRKSRYMQGLGLKKRFFFTVIFVDNFMGFFAKAIACYWFCLYL